MRQIYNLSEGFIDRWYRAAEDGVISRKEMGGLHLIAAECASSDDACFLETMDVLVEQQEASAAAAERICAFQRDAAAAGIVLQDLFVNLARSMRERRSIRFQGDGDVQCGAAIEHRTAAGVSSTERNNGDAPKVRLGRAPDVAPPYTPMSRSMLRDAWCAVIGEKDELCQAFFSALPEEIGPLADRFVEATVGMWGTDEETAERIIAHVAERGIHDAFDAAVLARMPTVARDAFEVQRATGETSPTRFIVQEEFSFERPGLLASLGHKDAEAGDVMGPWNALFMGWNDAFDVSSVESRFVFGNAVVAATAFPGAVISVAALYSTVEAGYAIYDLLVQGDAGPQQAYRLGHGMGVLFGTIFFANIVHGIALALGGSAAVSGAATAGGALLIAPLPPRDERCEGCGEI